FFFQAEDGIRDFHVTGVQTCALPILIMPPNERLRGHRDEEAIRALTHPEPVPVIEPDMALQGIHHISGITDDIDRAHEFYEAAQIGRASCRERGETSVDAVDIVKKAQ